MAATGEVALGDPTLRRTGLSLGRRAGGCGRRMVRDRRHRAVPPRNLRLRRRRPALDSARCRLCLPSRHRRLPAVQSRCLMLARLAHLTIRYRWPTIGLWLFLTVVGVFAASQVSSRWYTATDIPGQPAYEASQRSLHALGVGDRTPDVVVFHTAGDVTKSPGIERSMKQAAG